MKFIVCNAFSINMLERGGQDVAFVPVNVQAVRNLLKHEAWESAVGHADTAAVFSAEIGVQIPVSRTSVALRRYETSLIVGQYRGPRLPEGATALPEGAVIEWWQVYHPS